MPGMDRARAVKAALTQAAAEGLAHLHDDGLAGLVGLGHDPDLTPERLVAGRAGRVGDLVAGRLVQARLALVSELEREQLPAEPVRVLRGVERQLAADDV